MSSRKKRSSKNLKINTRILITGVLAVIIPLIIIGCFSPVMVGSVRSYFNFSTVTTKSYSLVNQIQWSDALNHIADSLSYDEEDEKKLEKIKSAVSSIEELGTVVYIEKGNGTVFYSTNENALSDAEKIVNFNVQENSNYFGDNGLVIVNHAKCSSDSYLIVIANEDYSVYDASQHLNVKELTNMLLSRTGIVVLVIVLLFILSITIFSFITTGTIVKPIKKIALGADEIARGNLDYEIDYKSTNELGQTVESFNEMRLKLKESIEKQNKAIDERNVLIAGIAHDLRTPLTSAKGYAEGLLDGIANTPEKEQKYIQTICSSINDTEKILDDLLTVSRLQLKGYSLNKVNVPFREFIADGIEEIRFMLESNNFELKCNINCADDTVVSMDTDAFERVISNIITNSVKYSRKDIKGRVEIDVNEYERSVIMEIKDNGIGVDKSSLVRIFDTMYRADPARTRVSEGSGLGLAVCKQIVELHGGIIWASSRENEGLTIHISLPKGVIQ